MINWRAVFVELLIAAEWGMLANGRPPVRERESIFDYGESELDLLARGIVTELLASEWWPQKPLTDRQREFLREIEPVLFYGDVIEEPSPPAEFRGIVAGRCSRI